MDTQNMPVSHRPERDRARRGLNAARGFAFVALLFFVGCVAYAVTKANRPPAPSDRVQAVLAEPSIRTPSPKVKTTRPATPAPARTTRAPVRKIAEKPRPVATSGFKNCAALRRAHPGGVPIGHRAYEPRLDRDSDGRACESARKVKPSPSRTSVTPKPKPSRTTSPAPEPATYANCTELRRAHPDGVPAGHPAYERKHDRDRDGWACETD